MRPVTGAGLPSVGPLLTGIGPCWYHDAGAGDGVAPMPEPCMVKGSPAMVMLPCVCTDEPPCTMVPADVEPSALLLAAVSTPPGSAPGLPKNLLSLPPSFS